MIQTDDQLVKARRMDERCLDCKHACMATCCWAHVAIGQAKDLFLLRKLLNGLQLYLLHAQNSTDRRPTTSCFNTYHPQSHISYQLQPVTSSTSNNHISDMEGHGEEEMFRALYATEPNSMWSWSHCWSLCRRFSWCYRICSFPPVAKLGSQESDRDI